MKNKILIITHGFFPEQSPRSFRATELSKEFCRQGHQVTIMAPYRHGMEGFLLECHITFKSLGELKWKIFNFKKPNVVGRLCNKVINRLFPLLFEYPMMEVFFKVRKYLKNEKNTYDLLISIAVPYPIHWGVASVWSKDKTKNIARIWVADCGDPYCLQENDTFRPPFYFQWVEKWFMRKADFISVPTESSHKGYYPEFHPKLKVIPQGFRFEEVIQQPVKKDGIVRFGYGGAFIPGRRDPREFLKYLVSLDPGVKFEFHIFTPHKHLVEHYVQLDKRIILHDPVTRLELLSELSSFDFVVNFSNKGTVQTPSKLIDYAIINKPILQIQTGNLDKNNLIAFLKGDYSKGLSIGNADRYRIESVTKQFLDLLP